MGRHPPSGAQADLKGVSAMQVAVSVLVGLAGGACALLTLASAAKTVVVPRAVPVLITRCVFGAMRLLFTAALWRSRDYRTQDRVMALFAPFGLLMLPLVWLVLVVVGYTAIFWAVGMRPVRDAFLESTSSLLTLGFRPPADTFTAVLALSEGILGLGLLALLVSYLPSIYASYSRRELMVTSLDTQAGSPPSAAELLERLERIDGIGQLDTFWQDWSRWFADIAETHTSTPVLVQFRSPEHDRSWVTAAGAVLDTAALVTSTLDTPRQPSAELCIRSGYLALHRIGAYFGMPEVPDPAPGTPISVTRTEYDAVCGRLERAGAKLVSDREQAWRDFAGWRVNYDTVLLRFAALTMAPPAPWSSDRAMPLRRRSVTRRRGRPVTGS
ncbi:hypothetical protein [Pseudonocardia xinjiangensis]|uniref:Uncharacterized protein n=1 Tax=Pseudonocardia xinjiangensis TaxID=75289 RepID=A0ABX1RG92_9PSEU|nr:hypothetical protein [Pseudonocardia xinjiangensis]NMH79408.1 hypothetical protein [Pseudonocardia xinjiangensis]